MKRLYYFYELITKLNPSNYAFCTSATYPDGDKIEWVENKGIIWVKTGNLVALDWTLLSSKWELHKKEH